MRLSPDTGSNRPEWLWAHDYADTEDQPTDLNTGLVSLKYITAAIRRAGLFCVAVAAAGLLIGCSAYLSLPKTYQASTTLYLSVGPESQPGAAISDDQAIIHSRTVAGLALHKLGLRESVDSFLSSYSATPLTDRVIVINTNEPSSSEAVRDASALATAFLQYRANQLQIQQRLLSTSLDQQVTQAKQQITLLNQKISRLVAQPTSPTLQAEISALRAQRSQANAALAVLEQSNNSYAASGQQSTTTQIKQSQVLDAAAPIPPHSRLKHLLLYAAIGVFGGLVLALGIVVVRAVISERLYRRDDVARALGAPVKISIGKERLSRSPFGRVGLEAGEIPGIQRIVAHLRSTVAANSHSTFALALVPVDSRQVPAISLVSLAISCAEQMGLRVMVADLCDTAPAARLLGVTESGVHTVQINDTNMTVAVPDNRDVTPIGPLTPATEQAPLPPCGKELAEAFAVADVMLTLVALDPSVGAEHLATWASDAVVTVTSGWSSWTRIHAAGEMIRLSGARLVSGVLIGADATDESLGVIYPPGVGDDASEAEQGFRDAERFLATLDRGPSGGPPDDR